MTNISNHPFVNLFKNNDLVILGGAMGTELQRRGYKTKLPLWSAGANTDVPELVKEIHLDYFNAGADICITNTFRTTPRTYKKLGREQDAHDALTKSVELALDAKEKIGRNVFCGGSYAPLEDCYCPELVPSKDELEHEHGQLAQWLKEAGVDFLMPETINDKNEAQAMAQAASNATLPFIISFVTDEKGKLLDGSDISEVLEVTDFPERVAVSLNCREIDTIDSAFNVLKEKYNGIVGLYPNGFGHPHDDLGWVFEDTPDSADKFANTALKWNQSGAKLIGGCCGATPDYIQALYDAYHQKKAA